GAGIIPGSQEAFQMLGHCKAGTETVEPEIDCSNYMEYVASTEYVASDIELITKDGTTMAPLRKPIKLYNQGLGFESRGDLTWMGNPPQIGSDEFKYNGKCKSGTDKPLEFNCSSPIRAFRLLPDMVLQGVEKGSDPVLVYDKDHNL